MNAPLHFNRGVVHRYVPAPERRPRGATHRLEVRVGRRWVVVGWVLRALYKGQTEEALAWFAGSVIATDRRKRVIEL